MKFVCPACMLSQEVEDRMGVDNPFPAPREPPEGWGSYSFWRQDKVTGNVVQVRFNYHLSCDKKMVVKGASALMRRIDDFNLDYV